jgi:hypothetical protein
MIQWNINDLFSGTSSFVLLEGSSIIYVICGFFLSNTLFGCVFVFVFLRLGYSILPVSLDCSFLVALLVFSNVYFLLTDNWSISFSFKYVAVLYDRLSRPEKLQLRKNTRSCKYNISIFVQLFTNVDTAVINSRIRYKLEKQLSSIYKDPLR